MWAGGGGCPGAVSERERDAVAAVYLLAYAERIKLKDAEIERLRLEVHNEKQYAADMITTYRCEAEDLKALLTLSADALDNPRAGSEALDEDYDLIIRLRKAAE
jgi:hypothetical protein